jgi:low affinity Fe/Cu permease
MGLPGEPLPVGSAKSLPLTNEVADHLHKKLVKHAIWERLSQKANRFLGTSEAMLLAFAIIILWVLSFLLGSFWHGAILEFAAMLTFLNMFTTQRGQTKELKALQVKLDELIASSSEANSALIKAETLPEHVLDQVHELYAEAARSQFHDSPEDEVVRTAETLELIMHEHHHPPEA